MVVKSVIPRGNLGSAQTEKRYSPGIWHNCPLDAIRNGEKPGIVFEFNFDTLPQTVPTTEGAYGLFAAFSSTGGAIDVAANGNGWVFSSDGDNEGASIRGRACPFKIIRSAYNLWYEAVVSTSTITDTKHNILCGLMQDVALTATMPITAAGALADTNFVGFQRPETARSTAGTGGAIMNTLYKADGVTAVTVQSDAVTISAVDTDVKLGMVFDPDVACDVADVTNNGSNKYLLSFFQDGIRCATTKQIPSAAGTDFPNDIQLGIVFAVLNATGTTPGNSTLRRLRVAQLFEPLGR